jgi:hypothetical protein
MLITPVPPVACVAAFSAQLPTFLSGASGISNQNYLGTPPAIPSAAQLGPGVPLAQQVFLLTLNAAASNPGVINPPADGWRFLAGHASAPVLARVAQLAPSQNWKLTGVFFGARVSDAILATQQLHNLPDVAKNDYELRVLVVPGLNLEAFWLVAQTAGSFDLIVPFPAGAEQPIAALRTHNPYKMVTFLALLRPLIAGARTMPAGYGA